MNGKEQVLLTKVIEMRKAQKQYFALRTQSALVQSKQLEKEVDFLCASMLQDLTTKPDTGPSQEELKL